jgi:hypothetical protein
MCVRRVEMPPLKKYADSLTPLPLGNMLQTASNIREKNVLAHKAEVPFSLSFVWMNVICSSLENCADVVSAFHVMTCVHGLCKRLDNNTVLAGERLTSRSASLSALVSSYAMSGLIGLLSSVSVGSGSLAIASSSS